MFTIRAGNWIGGVLITGVVLLSGCPDQAGLRSGTVYTAVDGNPSIKINSSKELEWTQGKDHLLCEYSREGDRVRVVLAVFGTKQVAYLTIIPDGLREEDGTVFYNPKRYEAVMAQVKAARRQKELDDQLIYATLWGDAGTVAELLTAGANPAVSDRQGSPAIYLAVGEGDLDKVKHLLGAGADCNARDRNGLTALHRAAPKGDAIVELLITSGADVNARDSEGYTPLMKAVTRRNIGAIRLLVSAGADRRISAGGKTAQDMARGDADTLAALRTAEEDAADASILREVLRSRKPFFGQARSSGTDYPFQINFESFDEANGRFAGPMNFYSPDDKSVLTFEGMLAGAVLSLSDTGVRKQGRSTPDWQYTLRLVDDERLVGHYSRKGSTSKRGDVWIDLNEPRRREMESKVAALLSFEAVKEQATTATHEILVIQRPMISSPSEVILTDVGLKGKWGWSGSKELLFARISKVVQRQEGKHWRIVVEGRSEKASDFRHYIDFPDKSECDKFYQAFSEAYNAWKTKYAEILTTNGQEKSSG